MPSKNTSTLMRRKQFNMCMAGLQQATTRMTRGKRCLSRFTFRSQPLNDTALSRSVADAAKASHIQLSHGLQDARNVDLDKQTSLMLLRGATNQL
eukprot:9359910-Alexandrium_andersonii.AAC.1